MKSVPQRGSVWLKSQYHNAVACGSTKTMNIVIDSGATRYRVVVLTS